MTVLLLIAMAMLDLDDEITNVAQPSSDEKQCGVNALYIVAKLYDIPCDLESLSTQFPPGNPEGYSMQDVQTAASKIGIRLEGVKCNKEAFPQNKIAIVRVTHEQSGHFIVVRPIGTTGKMVQVLDPLAEPYVIDVERLTNSEGWTGHLLVYNPLSPYWMLAGLCAFATMVGLIFALYLKRRQDNRTVG